MRAIIYHHMDILAAFKHAYADTLKDPGLFERIQQVKDALYRRSYLEAFGTSSNLEAYIVRWSPSRALAYAAIFEKYDATRSVLNKNTNALCIGGGAGAEIAALSVFNVDKIVAIDVGNWAPVTGKLAKELGMQNLEIVKGDALKKIASMDLSQTNLVTCLFTTNELVAQSKAGYVKMLQELNRCPSGALLVVIESAGSYSEIQIGQKKFPVHFLLHYTLTKTPDLWELIDSTDSEWYRLPEGLNYPWELQNMRYFLRIYRRKAPSPTLQHRDRRARR